jgi:catechol 2,3-dioxygenase-like lactoylglutathione lyase family enzyme
VSIQHVAVEVRREQAPACRDFYGLLGFVEVDPPATLRDRARWLQAGETQIHLLFAPVPVVSPEGHVAVVVADYDATLASLRDAGHDPDPRPEHWGSPRAFVRDPAGHRVELMAFPPSRPGRETGPGTSH